MTDQEILKRKIELKYQHIFLITQEIGELSRKLTIDALLNSTTQVSGTNDERLHNVIGFLAAVNPAVVPKILGLKDTKGNLLVIWDKPPTIYEMDVVNFTWGSSLVGDGCGNQNIEHRILVT